MPVYSHPPSDGQSGVELVCHLRDVRDRVGPIVPDAATTPAGEPVTDVVENLALVHDIGKATTWFQQHIGVRPGTPSHERLRYHAPLGSFAAYYVLRENGYGLETCLAGFVAVAKHHGRLPRVARYVAERTGGTGDETWLDAVVAQTFDIHDESRDVAATVFEDAVGTGDAWTSFASEVTADSDALFEEIREPVMGLEAPRDDPLTDEFYGLVLELWGALVLADKTSAAGAPDGASTYGATKPATADLDEHVASIEAEASAARDGDRTERLNHFRSRAREDVLGSIEEFAAGDSGVATITLPTGMGKTLTGLSAALELRDALDHERVVYALPFTSIIDQVVAEAEDVFPTGDTDDLLVTHHHLADTAISPGAGTDDEDADLNDDVAGMLGESWRAGLTVSTFVQLFESLAGPRNAQSMKVPALRDSVVVLDEPQSLPMDWWKLVARLVDVLTEQYGATVVAMTATQPELFDGATELVDDVDRYFEVAERVEYHLHESFEAFLAGEDTTDALGYGAAAAELAATARDDSSVLAICNTIDSARELTATVIEQLDAVDLTDAYFEALDGDADDPEAETVERVESAESQPFVHLSTRLRPTDRLALIRCIKALRERDVPVVAVTTQLVEAGVDLSFERVYRDLAPVDSVVQAAGRCNRSFEREHGDVTLWWLAPPENCEMAPASAVYDRGRGPALTPVTADALDSEREAGETTLDGETVSRDAVTEYYQRLDEDKDVGSDEYVSWVDTADGEQLAGKSLIDTPRSVDVIVCYTDADHDLVDDLEAAYGAGDYGRVDELLDETKPLRVSVPIYDVDSVEADVVRSLEPLAGMDDNADVRVLRRTDHQFESTFEKTTGFVVEQAGVDDRFL